MTTALLLQRKTGRFGRDVQAEPADDQLSEVVGYEVDPEAVATALLERLDAGRTLRLPRR
jgi:hypothetical protein